MARKNRRPDADIHNYQTGSTADDPSCTIKSRAKGGGKAQVVNVRGKGPDLKKCIDASNAIIRDYIPDAERKGKAKAKAKTKKAKSK